MKELLRKLFGFHQGEGAQALRFIKLAICWAFGSSCLDTLSDGLFLEHIGSGSLPQIYLTIALGMIGVSSIVLYSLKVTSPYRILMITMALGAILSSSAALFMTGIPLDWFWYGLKVASRMFFSVMLAVSWTFTDQYHDLQDAKRVYSLYGAAYFTGTILSGSLINLFLERVGFSSFMALGALAILCGMWVARGIALKAKAVHDDSIEGIFSGSRDSISSVIRSIFRSRFTITLLLLSLFIQLMWTTTEFNYFESMSEHLGGEGHIAEFLGKCRASISFCNILFGVLFYSRIVRKAGIQNVVLITPLFYLAVYSGWVWQDSLMIAVLGLIAVDGVLFTIEDNCFNLLSNAVPTKLKSRVRIINDSFFEPIGMLLSSILLFFFQSGGKWLGLVLTLLALAITLAIRAIYSTAILSNLKENAIHFERTVRGWIGSLTKREQKTAKQDILKSLYKGTDESRLLAAQALLQLEDREFLPQILDVSRKMSTFFKIGLLKLFDNSPFCGDSRILELIHEWVETTVSAELYKTGNFYLAKRGLHHPDKVEDDLDHEDLTLRGAAILTLKNSFANPTLDYAALNRTIAAKKLSLMLKSGQIDEIALALDILAEDESIESAERSLEFLSHESILVKRSAAKCIAQIADKRFGRHTPKILEELEWSRDNLFRLHLLEALGKIADTTTVKEILTASVHFRPNERRKVEEIIVRMGLKTVPLLLSLTKDLALPERARILAGKILSRLALPQLQANLIDILDIEIERAYFYFHFAHTIQKQYPLYDLELLQSALLTGYQSVIDFIIHLLGAAGSLEDPDLLVRALHSKNQKIHSQAVESLEKTCHIRIFKLIAPLIDDLPLEEKMAACLEWQGDFLNLTLSELLDKLGSSPTLFDKIVATRLKAQLKMPEWRAHLREQMIHSGESFHQFAYELLEHEPV